MGGARGSRVQLDPIELDEETEETVPISSVVPRTKTILPGDPQVRPLPAVYKNEEIRHTNDRGMIERDDDDEAFDVEDLRSPARYATPPRAGEWWPDRSTLQRPQSSALGAPVPVAARQTESTDDLPRGESGQWPVIGETIEVPDLNSGLVVPDNPEYIIDEPWPQDPAGYDLSCPPQGTYDCHCWGPIKKFLYFNQTNGDIGIGHERVMFAPFEIETSQPANNFRLKMVSAFGLQTPDRAEYLWAKIGGPGPMFTGQSVNYQNFDAIYEAGGKRFSFVTDIPLRNVQAGNNFSGAGIGNISLAPKVVLVSGDDWQITQIFRTYLPTGATQRGASNGLVSLEPGVLVRYRWSPRTYVHSQLKYWIPLTGDPIASGNVFNYGLGVSHVLHETDTFAIIPVLETIGWTVGGGTATLPVGLTTSANTSFVNIQPGVRFVLGPKGDLGLCEFGIGCGFATNVTGWYQEQLTVELRWSW